MSRRISSLGDLKKALRDKALDSALDFYEKGNYKEAVELFDSMKDLSVFDTSIKPKIKGAYYRHGMQLQHDWRLQDALHCFVRARETDPDDAALLSRVNLLRGYQSYRKADNIGKFRAMVKEGFTEGKYGNHPSPFLAIAENHGLLEEAKELLIESKHITEYYSIGIYRRLELGRHLLSNLIRQFKYRGNSELSMPFAWLLADFIRYRTDLLKYIDLIIPLPSNPNNQIERGFTPCLLIAKELSECLAIPYYELFLVKPMDCRFREMGYDEGKKFIRYKSGQSRNISKGRRILILDDVATRGRTLSLHAEVLTENGADSVYAMTIAKTVHYR